MSCPACGLVHALPATDTPLVELPNLGGLSGAWLSDAGINTLADLQVLGSVKTYLLVQALGVNPSLNLLYALEAALHGSHWLEVKREQRTVLLSQLAAVKEQSLI
jgi:DNA transformation protein and related proteins